ncbi:l-ascorbic acid binding protein [Colletotrichum incanum]|uniref:L-ascorbic acid binding protein n=1 Tax=Colletotrichum incanum TaxID=1573173 RepID=A0A167DCR4_COLIC|nr:l-ascorbic acid binding protein [Colletotrichum incanum]
MGKPKSSNAAKTKAGGGASNGSNTKSATPSTLSAPPAWPQFKPPLPVTDLVPDKLDPCPDKVVLVRNFWPKSLCGFYVTFLRGLPLITTPGRPKRGEAVRVNDRFQVQDAAFAQRLWTETGLRESLGQEDIQGLWGGEVVGLNPNIRIYRYSKGQYFDAHYDDSNNVSLTLDPSTGPVTCKTTWTLLLYLTSSAEGCVGGETVFFPNDRRSAKEEIPVALETGMLLLHKHGDDCMLHEGREVTAGEKWVLRTDLCVRK